MFLMYCDESNLEPRDTDFFIYGGIAIEANSAGALHEQIEKLRIAYKIPSEAILKFNQYHDALTHQQYIEFKSRLFLEAAKHNCQVFLSMIHHRIATSVDDARRNEINRVVFHFNSFLNRVKDSGLVLIDRFDDRQIDSHLREKFSVGLTGMPYSDKLRLSNIIGIHYSAIGQSHFGSLIDIIIGSIRFSVNAFTQNDTDRLRGASAILPQLARLFPNESNGSVSEINLFFSPKTIRSDKYRKEYQAVKEFMERHGIVAAQDITGSRKF